MATAERDRPLTRADIEVVPASAERWADIVAIMAGHGERGCWCQYWRRSSAAYSALEDGAAERSLRALLDEGNAPGVIAYMEGQPAGWCGLWPRERFERLVRSRTIPVVDDVPVWSIVCFLVRTGYRRRGVARALLHGAIDHTRAAGAPALESYPIDPGGQRADVAFGYVGFVSMFEAAGFHRVIETAARSDGRPRILMRKTL